MDAPSTQGFVLELWHGAVALIGAGAAWAWRFVTGDIRQLREESVTKQDFHEYAQRAEQTRVELRRSIIDLYKGQDDIKEALSTQTIRLLEAIHKLK